MKNSLEKLLQKLPKQDLHLHLDGSIRLETMIEIAKEQHIKLPSYTKEGLETLLFKDNYSTLEEYLKTFEFSCAVMQTPENLERIAYELAIDCQKEGVCYIEVRFDPLLITNKNQSSEKVLQIVNKGLQRAQKEYNQSLEVQQQKKPAFHYGIILCILRFAGAWSEQYTKIYESFPSISSKKLMQFIGLEQAHFAIKMREQGLPVVALDLAGSEKANSCSLFVEAYELAAKNLLHKIVHAGESDGVHSICDAVNLLRAERIGHGFSLFSEHTQEVENLIRYLRNKKITIEVCLTSNLQTLPKLKNVQNHSYKKMLENELSIVICTDNRTVSKTSITKELLLARSGVNFTPQQFKNLVLNGFDKSFFVGKKKQEYRQLCDSYYDYLVKNTELDTK